LKYLLDTNVCVDYLTGQFPSVTAKLADLEPEDVAISAIAVAELRYGADKSSRPRGNHSRLDEWLAHVPLLDFDARAASEYGRIRCRLEAKGTPIGPNDLLIAAQALSRGATLVTDNEGEFRRVRGLRVENWR
jgi:tRNA(fMet)-specific endonuclease VapC